MGNFKEKTLKSFLKRKISLTKATLITFLISGNIVFTAPLITVAKDTTEDLVSKDGSISWENAISVEGTANLTGDVEYNIETEKSKYDAYEPTGIAVGGGGKIIGNHSLTLNIAPAANENGKIIYPAGARITGGGTIQVKDLNVKVVEEMEAERVGNVDNAAYGLQIGTGINWADTNKDKTSKVIVENSNIEVTNTKNSKRAGWYKTLPFLGESKIFDVYHQLAGIRLIRVDGSASSTPYYESTGNTVINVHDSSRTGDVANYNVGIYVSGEGSKAILNNSHIKISGNGTVINGDERYGSNSSALKIGKARQTGKGAGTIESKGNMILDTKESPYAPAVRLLGEGSTLKANFENSSTNIESASTAILYGIEDFKFRGGFGGVAGAENGKDQTVLLKNANLSTTSKNDSLIKVETKKINEIGNSYYGGYNKYNGTFGVENATLELSGEKTNAVASDNGWLIEVQGLKNKASSLTSNIKDGAKIEGLVHKEFESSHNLTMENNASWKLKNKGEDKTSTLSNLTLNNSTLDASFKYAIEKKQVLPKDLLDKIEETKENLELAEALKEFDPTDETLIANYNDALKKKEEAEKELEDYKKANPIVPEVPKADYVIKLSSDGKLNDGKLLNDNGTINLINDSYADKLTIDGDYEGNDGNIVVNTLWNTPGNKDESGENSETDTIEITGTASGTTNVYTVNTTGKEYVLDGTIGELEDAFSKSKPVIIANNDANPGSSFTGSVKSNSAADIELSYRLKDGKHEYFWEVKKINKSVAQFIAIPSIMYETSFATLGTLNERKGNFVNIADNYQMWAKINGRHLSQNGKIRTSYSSSLFSLTTGIEKVKDNKHNGLYLAYTANRGEMYSKKEINPTKNDKYVYDGLMNTHSLSLGLTHTRYKKDGSYLDLVGQLSYNINNIYDDTNIYKANTRGIGLVLSAEAGKTYYFKDNKYIFEPQVQVIYQINKTFNVNIDNKNISFDTKHGLRGRIGARIMNAENTFYTLANLWLDFTNKTNVNIGKDKMSESYDKVWLELGIGKQANINKDIQLYGDARIEKGLNRFGVKGTIGIKKTW